jgi:hypothetical protein
MADSLLVNEMIMCHELDTIAWRDCRRPWLATAKVNPLGVQEVLLRIHKNSKHWWDCWHVSIILFALMDFFEDLGIEGKILLK